MTELELVEYESPDKVKQRFVDYLDKVCLRPDTIWVTYKPVNFIK